MTTLSSIAESPPAQRRPAPDLLAALSRAFDREFDLCEDRDEQSVCERLAADAGWHGPIDWDDPAGREPGGAGQPTAPSPTVRRLDRRRCLLAVPIRRKTGGPLWAGAVVDSGDPALVLKLAQSTVRNARLQRRLRRRRKELDAYADRVTRDFEELWWLRKLAESIDYCEITSGPEMVATALLPSLREIIEAEAVAMIPARQQQGSAEPAPVEGPWCWAGEHRIAESACRDLVLRFGRSPEAGPVVKNGLLERGEFAGSAIDSFILVPVARPDWHFGWLLALNKTGCGAAGPVTGGYTAGLSEPEFGSFESGLLGSAAAMLAAHARNADLFRQRELLLIGVIRTLVNAIDAKDAYTCGHSDRVARIAMRLAEELGLDHQGCLQVYMTGLLHDVGKIGVPDAILCKPGKLTEEEFAVVKRHPSMGYQILKHLKQLEYVLPGVLHHHESVTGTGYPVGLAGEEIPLIARILAVADSYDAMTSSRPYREAMPFERAEAIIRGGAGQQWDPAVVAALFRALDGIHEICIDSESRQQTIHGSTGDELELPPEAFAER